MNQSDNNQQPRWRHWLKRAGVAGFLFFLIKGLLWVGVAAFAGKTLFD